LRWAYRDCEPWGGMAEGSCRARATVAALAPSFLRASLRLPIAQRRARAEGLDGRPTSGMNRWRRSAAHCGQRSRPCRSAHFASSREPCPRLRGRWGRVNVLLGSSWSPCAP
jgi:hypothetical protein